MKIKTADKKECDTIPEWLGISSKRERQLDREFIDAISEMDGDIDSTDILGIAADLAETTEELVYTTYHAATRLVEFRREMRGERCKRGGFRRSTRSRLEKMMEALEELAEEE